VRRALRAFASSPKDESASVVDVVGEGGRAVPNERAGRGVGEDHASVNAEAAVSQADDMLGVRDGLAAAIDAGTKEGRERPERLGQKSEVIRAGEHRLRKMQPGHGGHGPLPQPLRQDGIVLGARPVPATRHDRLGVRGAANRLVLEP